MASPSTARSPGPSQSVPRPDEPDALAALAAARDRDQGLLRITAALSRSATPDEVLDVVLTELVDAVNADGAATTLLDGDGTTLHVQGAVGYPSGVVEALRTFPADAPLPLAVAVRRRERVLYRSKAEMLADNPGLENLVTPRDRAVGAWPLIVADGVIGSVGLSWSEPRTLTNGELTFLDAVVGQLAQAIDRARLYEAESEARRAAERTAEQLAFLADASRILSESLDLAQTLRRLSETVVPRLADWCAVYVVNEDGTPRHVATNHLDPEKAGAVEELQRRWPVRLDAPTGMGRSLRTGETLVFEDISDDLLHTLARDEEHLAALRRVGIGSAMVVPLRIRGRALGAIAAGNDASRRLSRSAVGLLEEVAARAAVAVTNAQAYEERSAVAAGLQASLLPRQLPVVPGLEMAARYLAAGEGMDVGGDFYDAFAGHGGRFFLAVGDVCGKGVDAAALTGLARHTIRCAALHSRSPRRVLTDLNRMLLAMEAETLDHSWTEPRFCSVCLAAVSASAEGTTVRLCLAGHPPPMLLRADGDVREVGDTGSLLGIVDVPDLPERTVHLEPGDALVVYTDGITERRSGDGFFEDRLGAVLSGLASLPADVVAEELQRAASTFAPDPPTDDMAILVVRHPPDGSVQARD